jgi:quinol monooxygenase YgiN
MSIKNQYLLSRRNALRVIVAGLSTVTTQSVFSFPSTLEEQEKEKMSITVVVCYETKKEKREEFEKIMNSVKTDLPKVNGCVSASIFQSATNKNRFTLVETWESKELHQNHIDKLSENGTWDLIVSHLAKDPINDYYIEI